MKTKRIALIIIIYIAGVFASYNYGKSYIKDFNKQIGKKDTMQDKVFVSALSTFSWMTFIAFSMANIADNIDEKKEINW